MELKQKIEERLPQIRDLANQYGFGQEIETA